MAFESLPASSTNKAEAEAGSPPISPVPKTQSAPQAIATPTPEAAPPLAPAEDDAPPGADAAGPAGPAPPPLPPGEETPSRALPTSDAFLRRLLRSSHSGDGGGAAAAEDDKLPLPEEELRDLEAALAATEDPPDPSAGTDDAARVLQHFCRRYGGDARTLRTIVDVLLRLQPPLHNTDLWLCLTAFIPRFAPVALLLEAGRTVIRLCQLFEQLLLFHDPEVAFLLRRAKLGAEIYCAPWILTAHAAVLSDPGAVLHIWDGWLERRGESLDPIFMGLARLMLCHEELLLCGPVPELAQLLQASLGAEQHSSPRVVQDALRRAEELKTLTPLTFLRQLQDALLRPPAAEEPAAAAEAVAPAQSGPPPASPRGDGKVASPQAGAPPQTPRAKAAAWIRNRWSSATHAFHAESAEAVKVGASMVCMRVEPQDVMMMETVKERHLKKAVEKKAAAESPGGAAKKVESPGTEQASDKKAISESPGSGKKAGSESPDLEQAENKATPEGPEGGKNAGFESPVVKQAPEERATSESPDGGKNAGSESPGIEEAASEAAAAEEPAPAQDEKAPPAAKGCRLLPKLIDVRPVAESRSYGVKGAVGVNVAATDSVPEFIKWAAKRESDAAAYGLRPMHILMTADGSINADQQRFIAGSLQKGVTAICILAGGYNSLKPFFVEPADGASSEPRALAERAQEAKELLQKGIGGLHGLWQKAPSRQHLRQNLLERVAPEGARGTKSPATFERAPMPPSVVLPATSPTSGSPGGAAELIGTGARTPTGADAVF